MLANENASKSPLQSSILNVQQHDFRDLPKKSPLVNKDTPKGTNSEVQSQITQNQQNIQLSTKTQSIKLKPLTQKQSFKKIKQQLSLHVIGLTPIYDKQYLKERIERISGKDSVFSIKINEFSKGEHSFRKARVVMNKIENGNLIIDRQHELPPLKVEWYATKKDRILGINKAQHPQNIAPPFDDSQYFGRKNDNISLQTDQFSKYIQQFANTTLIPENIPQQTQGFNSNFIEQNQISIPNQSLQNYDMLNALSASFSQYLDPNFMGMTSINVENSKTFQPNKILNTQQISNNLGVQKFSQYDEQNFNILNQSLQQKQPKMMNIQHPNINTGQVGGVQDNFNLNQTVSQVKPQLNIQAKSFINKNQQFNKITDKSESKQYIDPTRIQSVQQPVLLPKQQNHMPIQQNLQQQFINTITQIPLKDFQLPQIQQQIKFPVKQDNIQQNFQEINLIPNQLQPVKTLILLPQNPAQTKNQSLPLQKSLDIIHNQPEQLQNKQTHIQTEQTQKNQKSFQIPISSNVITNKNLNSSEFNQLKPSQLPQQQFQSLSLISDQQQEFSPYHLSIKGNNLIQQKNGKQEESKLLKGKNQLIDNNLNNKQNILKQEQSLQLEQILGNQIQNEKEKNGQNVKVKEIELVYEKKEKEQKYKDNDEIKERKQDEDEEEDDDEKEQEYDEEDEEDEEDQNQEELSDNETEFDMSILDQGTDEEKKNNIGEFIYEFASKNHSYLAGKITGTILNLDLEELIIVVQDNKLLEKQIYASILLILQNADEVQQNLDEQTKIFEEEKQKFKEEKSQMEYQRKLFEEENQKIKQENKKIEELQIKLQIYENEMKKQNEEQKLKIEEDKQKIYQEKIELKNENKRIQEQQTKNINDERQKFEVRKNQMDEQRKALEEDQSKIKLEKMKLLNENKRIQEQQIKKINDEKQKFEDEKIQFEYQRKLFEQDLQKIKEEKIKLENENKKIEEQKNVAEEQKMKLQIQEIEMKKQNEEDKQIIQQEKIKIEEGKQMLQLIWKRINEKKDEIKKEKKEKKQKMRTLQNSDHLLTQDNFSQNFNQIDEDQKFETNNLTSSSYSRENNFEEFESEQNEQSNLYQQESKSNIIYSDINLQMSICIDNLPIQITEDELMNIFKQYDLQSINILKSDDEQQLNVGYITFKSEEQLQRALIEQKEVEIKSQKLVVRPASTSF